MLFWFLILNLFLAVPLSFLASKSNIPSIRESIVRDGPIIPITRLPIGDKQSIIALNGSPPNSGTVTINDPEKGRPSLSLLSVFNSGPGISNPGLSPSSASVTTPSSRSPDLLDLLIPNGHIVAPISSRGRKRSASTPSPIVIQPHRDARYEATNGDDEIFVDGAKSEVEEIRKAGTHTQLFQNMEQTFPETPVLFSPDFPSDMTLPSSGREGILTRSNTTVAGLRFTRIASNTRRRNATLSPSKPIAIPETPRIPPSPLSPLSNRIPNTLKFDISDSKSETKQMQVISPSSEKSSPPISPLKPLNISPTDFSPLIQIALENGPRTPPLLAPAPTPRRRTVLSRPPLPYGPRKPNTASNSRFSSMTVPSIGGTRRTVSESTIGMENVIQNSFAFPDKSGSMKEASSGSNTSVLNSPAPSFKTSPIAWRGLTLDAAKWTMSSSQLQDIVRSAIEKSAQPTSIRLLSQDIVEKEIPASLQRLRTRRADLQKDYKVLVRRRQAILRRLISISPGGPRSDTASIVRDAEELAELASTCDRLTEELHGIDDQITQLTHLKDVHLSSALAMALRKLNTSYVKQSATLRELQFELTNLSMERDEAWKKAEELEMELDMLSEQSPISSLRAVKSIASSCRSSRVGITRKGSARRASIRSSVSSFYANPSATTRSAFSSEIVPPVPPIPTLDFSNGGTFLSVSSDSYTPRIHVGPSSCAFFI